MGFWGLSLAGVGFICVGIWQAFSTAKIYLTRSQTPPPSYRKRPFYTGELVFIASLATLFILDGVFTSYRGLQQEGHLGLAIQLEKSGVASIFLLYSIVGIICECTQLLPLPWEALNLIALFAFGEEFLVFYLQREGSTGIEDRYYSLILVPICVCILCKALEIPYPKSVLPQLGFSMGLILQGTWFIQMGISFFTGWISHGCKIYEKSGGDYTIHCESHTDGHRARAIATLQFNYHLALLLISLLPAYSYLSTKYVKLGAMNYKPLSEQPEELREFDGSSVEFETRFALDSDEDEAHEGAPLPDHGIVPQVNGVHQVSV
uniref:TSA: Wollemia nobilis Ref_Wollemi_Transcript_25910_1523 transcribed RNA sequence n=1 Tax=Wollemia nobilis TaxID=56998 RepID=A0A0C9RQ76_9CONI